MSKICRALSTDGFFVTGEAERDMVDKQERFCTVAPASAIFKKRGGK
jgi:hypothetical protein